MNSYSMEYPPILMIASARHDAPYASTAYAMAKEMAGYTQVFFIDNPFTWKDYLSSSKKNQINKRYNKAGRVIATYLQPEKKLPNLKVIISPLEVPGNFLKPGSIFNLVRSWNTIQLAKSVRSIFSEKGITDYIFINSFNPYYWNLPKYIFPASKKIYQTVDRISQAPYLRKHGPRLELEAFQQADLGITTSQFLEKYYSSTGEVHCIPNAADVKLFNSALNDDLPRPKDWPETGGKPVVIYTGHFDLRSNLDLIEEVCIKMPDVAFVFLGPSSGKAALWASNSRLNNVFFIGEKSLNELPAYLKLANVGIIPFLCNQLTEAIYPLKINEYLAAGLAVVATPFSEDIRSFQSIITIAENADGWVKAIRQAFNNTPLDIQKRVEVALENTWKSRVELFWKIVNKKIRINERAA